MKGHTLLIGSSHLTISPAEALILAPLVEELKALDSREFTRDVPAWQATPPAHVLTPSRVKALVAQRLESLAPARARDLERRILSGLMINGYTLEELAAGAPAHGPRRGARSRVVGDRGATALEILNRKAPGAAPILEHYVEGALDDWRKRGER